MLKSELIEMLKQIFESGGNHDPFKLSEIREKLIDFLKAEKEKSLLSYENNENIVIAIDAVRFIDANYIFAKTSNRIEASIPVKPLFDRLIQLDDWNYYELKFLIGLINFAPNAEQAVRFAAKAEKAIMNFQIADNTDVSKGALACNVCSRLLYAKYFDDDVKDELTQEFSTWFCKLEQLAKLNNELEVLFLATRIRQAIFNNDFQEVDELFKRVVANSDEKIVKVVKSEICFYIASRGGEESCVFIT